MAKKKIVYISQTDPNMDWIKTEKNRESERRIHEKLAEDIEKQNA